MRTLSGPLLTAAIASPCIIEEAINPPEHSGCPKKWHFLSRVGIIGIGDTQKDNSDALAHGHSTSQPWEKAEGLSSNERQSLWRKL